MAVTRRNQRGGQVSGASGTTVDETADKIRLVIRGNTKRLLKDIVSLYNQQRQRLGKMQAAVNVLARSGCNPENMDQIQRYVVNHLDDFVSDMGAYKTATDSNVAELRRLIGSTFYNYCNDGTVPSERDTNTVAANANVPITFGTIREPPVSNIGISGPANTVAVIGAESGALESGPEGGISLEGLTEPTGPIKSIPESNGNASGFNGNASGFNENASGFNENASGFNENASGFNGNASGFNENASGSSTGTEGQTGGRRRGRTSRKRRARKGGKARKTRKNLH